MKRVVLVSDPMCSWCWGMARDFEGARAALEESFEFDLMLGGINTHGTQPIGDYGRRYLMKLWQEVEATTGQAFGFALPEAYVHNSVLPCLLLEAWREDHAAPPFALLHELQQRFFVHGESISDLELLSGIAESYAVSDFAARVGDPGLTERVRFQFENAGAFGTNAMPSLLIDDERGLSLLAGGYVDAEMMQSLLAAQK